MVKRLIGIIILFSFYLSDCIGQDGWQVYEQGAQLMILNEFEDAIPVFEMGVKLNDESQSINFYGLAYCNHELKQYELAKSFIKEALKTELSNDSKIYSAINWLSGRIAEAEGNSKLELSFYEKAFQYEPFDNELKTTLGLALIENEKFDRSIILLTEIIETTPNAYAFCNRSLAYIKKNKLDLAKADLKESKKLDSENPFLYENYFLYYKEIGKRRKACESLNFALEKKMDEYGIERDSRRLKSYKENFCKKI